MVTKGLDSVARLREPPIVVHCSAGIGRSGTYVTLDRAITKFEDTEDTEDTGKVHIEDDVRKLRSERAMAITTSKQYIFCHQAFLEYASRENHSHLLA